MPSAAGQLAEKAATRLDYIVGALLAHVRFERKSECEMIRSGYLWVCVGLLLIAGPILAQEEDEGFIRPEPVAGIEADSAPDAVAISADGRFVYIANTESASISIYARDTASDAYNPVEGSPFDASGSSYQPFALAISPDDTALYVANLGFIEGSTLVPVTILNIDAQSGALSYRDRIAVPSTGGQLRSIAVSSDGNYLVLAEDGRNSVTIFALAGAQAEAQRLSIAPYRSFCQGVGPQLCYLVSIDGEEQLFYTGIEGFDYEWGTSYELRVRVESIENPPADGSSLRYVLEEVLNATPVDSSNAFTLRLPAQAISLEEDGSYSFFEEERFTLGDAAQADALAAALAEPEQILEFQMRFGTEAGDPLRATFVAP